MKIRDGFVSNSSSSSFIISANRISVAQLELLKNHAKSEDFLKDKWLHPGDAWDIEEKDGYIKADTFMDNFNFYNYAIKIGLKSEDIDMY